MTLLPLPEIDDRAYDELVSDAISRISIHNPDWTNHNEADPGITILELFAFMTETLLYRSRLIPERNRLAFLDLLGVDVKGATAASGVVAFTNARGSLAPNIVEADTQLYAGAVSFQASNGLAVLPVEAKPYVKRTSAIPEEDEAAVRAEYELYYASFLGEAGAELSFYESADVEWPAGSTDAFTLTDTIDGSLWLAVLARPGDDLDQARAAIDGQVLSIAVVPALDERSKEVEPGAQNAPPATRLEVHIPDVSVGLTTDPATRVPTYQSVDFTASTDLLREPGVLQVQLPGAAALQSWALEPTEAGVGAFPPALEGNDAERLITWIRIRPEATEETELAGGQAEMRLSWLGGNAAFVEQRIRTVGERVGSGSGEPDQAFELANAPVILDTLDLFVDGERWERVDDLMTAGPEVPTAPAAGVVSARDARSAAVFTADRQTGELRFGTGVHGARPRRGAAITADYAHGGGRAGMVAPGAITKGPTLPPGITVTNPVATWGGAEAASVADAERTVAGFIRTRDQLVSADDFRAAAEEAPGIELGRVEVLPLFHPEIDAVRVPGVVTLVVIPASDPRQPDAPQPDRLFLDALCAHLSPRRIVTTELYVTGPTYVPIWVSVGIDVEVGRDLAPVIEAVKNRIRTFLSPLPTDGEDGWRLGRTIDRLELLTEAARVDGVLRVVDLDLADQDGITTDAVPLGEIELPRLVGLSVRQGPPGPAAPQSESASPELVPVPFVPEEC